MPIHAAQRLVIRVLHVGVILLAGLGMCRSIQASPGFLKSPERIFKENADAVVRIEVQLHQRVISTGTGFLISRNGEVITSQHVVRPFLHHPHTKIEIRTRDGRRFHQVKLGACSSANSNFAIDLCHFKVNGLRNARHLRPTDRRPSPGEAVAVIGHPRGLDHSITTGIVSGLRANDFTSVTQRKVRFTGGASEELQIDAAINPGNSGGPIFGKLGDLIGVVYQIERDGQNISFGISAKALKAFLDRSQPRGFRSIQEARKLEVDEVALQVAKWMTETHAPPLDSPAPSISSLSGKNWRWTRLMVGQQKVRALVPAALQACQRLEPISAPDPQAMTPQLNTSLQEAAACVSSAGEWQLSIQSRAKPQGSGLLNFRNRQMVDPRPLQLMTQLELEGRWEPLPSRQRRDFLSRPGKAQCFAVEQTGEGDRRLPVGEESNLKFVSVGPHSMWKDALSICRFRTSNDQEPGGVSASVWIETPRALYEVSVWSFHPAHQRLSAQLADLIALTLIRDHSPESSPIHESKRQTQRRTDREVHVRKAVEFKSGD